MPQAATPNMALIKPTENGDSGVWASLLDAMFDLIDQHDHSTGKGVKVSMANGVSVAADIPWNSGGTFYAITGLKAIDFQPQPQASMSTFAGALFVDSANNELSYRTTGGSIIRFTNGATFNFSAIGAIGGDYTSVGALVDFVDANDLYRFRQQLGGGVQQYARLDCGGVDLFEFKANPAVGVPANRVRMSSPAALAASYELTWPGAVPGAQVLAQVDATGQWFFSNSLAANQSVVVSGTGRFKHGDVIMHVSPIVGSGGGWAWDATNGYLLSSGAGTWSIGVPSLVGWRLKSLTFELFGDGAADLAGGVLIRHKAGAVATDVPISVINQPAAFSDVVVNFTDTTIVDGDSFYINLTANAANLRVGEIRVTYDFP